MINDLLLRWVVTALSALSGVESALAIVTDRRAWTLVVSDGLRLVMAIAMAVMAWPVGMRLAGTGPAVFFLLAAAWFATVAVVRGRPTAQRAVWGYHALTMIAMAWMLAVMNGHLLPGGSHTTHHMSPDMSMPGMDMAEMDTPESGGAPGWVTAIDWFWAVAFTLVTAFWTYRFVAERRRPMSHLWRSSLGSGGQAAMAAAMAVMFGAMLFRA
jgi:hypothetical protein